jgi:hypothetical protein
MTTAEAEEHLRAISNARTSIRTLMGTIRKHQTALISVAVKTYNDVSADLDGMIADNRWTVIGFAPCNASPIGVCVYNERVMSLPSQRRGHHVHAGSLVCHSDCGTDACLFCGVPMDDGAKQDGRQLLG